MNIVEAASDIRMINQPKNLMQLQFFAILIPHIDATFPFFKKHVRETIASEKILDFQKRDIP